MFAALRIDPAARQRLLPNASREKHRTGASEQRLIWFTRETAERALSLYRRDYETFRLPLPDLVTFTATREPSFTARWSKNRR
jgi:hypothetical protein